MREHWPKVVIVLLLVVVVGLPFALSPLASEATLEGQPTSGKLVIITPHNEQIRAELEHGYNQNRLDRGLPPIEFDWRTSGGTSDLRKAIISQFEPLVRRGDEDAGIGADLFFGGGEYEHNKLVSGVEAERDGETVKVPLSMPPDLPEGLVKEAMPEPTIGGPTGERLYAKDQRWIGTTLSSFGIVYNRDLLDMLGVPEPKTWSDLANPRLAGYVALSDPAHSGSIAVTYDTIVRRSGWGGGWNTLRRVFANTRYFTNSSSKVPVDISRGEAAAGAAIDFYGRFQAGAVGDDRVGYVDPVGLTATTADPISLIRGAPSEALAEDFIAWMLSKDAQRLWQQRIGTDGGPVRFELRRQPIRPDLFVPEEMQHWADRELDPYGEARPMPEGMPSFYSVIGPLTHAIAIDVLDDLHEAWEALRAVPEGDPRRAAMLERFDAMPPELRLETNVPPSEQQAVLADPSDPRHAGLIAAHQSLLKSLEARWKADPDQALRDRLAWTLFFRENYRAVAEME